MAQVSEIYPSSTEVSSEDTARPDVSAALAEVAAWLLNSPNNPDYEHSPTYTRFKDWLDSNQELIDEQYLQGVREIEYTHVNDDLRLLGQLQSEPNRFLAYDAAYAGDAGKAANTFRDTTVDDGAEVINANARQAIASTLLRSRYFELLSANILSVSEEFGERPFIRAYRQNILAIIQLAARLEAEAKALESDKSAHSQSPALELVA